MAAVLALCIFVVASTIGLSLVRVFDRDAPPAIWLQSPTIGFAAVTIVAANLNRLGLPVGWFATPLVLTAVVAAVAVIAFRSAGTKILHLWPFLVIAIIAGVAIGWPVLEFGFNWVSFANHDMVNYSLEAERFLGSGWDRAPSIDVVESMRSTPQLYWLFNVLVGERYASSELLAVVMALSGRAAYEIFMPTMLALTMALVLSTCGLVYKSEMHRRAALLTGGLLIVNADFALGTLSQLLDQVFGLALVCAIVVAMRRPLHRQARIACVVIPAIALAGLCYIYPECLPLAIIASAIQITREIRSGALAPLVKTMLPMGAILALAAIMVNVYAITDIVVFRLRTDIARPSQLFPYYLLPNGLGNVVGIVAQGTFPTGALSDVLIALGALYVLLGVAAIALGLADDEPSAYVAAIIVLMSVVFFFHRSTFTLFKMAMFIQPFATAAIALLIMRAWSRARNDPGLGLT